MPSSTQSRVKALLHPKNVVLAGASDRPGGWPARIQANLARFGYRGELHMVNPRRETVLGQISHRSVRDVPGGPDHLVVLVPAVAAVSTVVDAVAAGARSATIFSNGLTQQQLCELAGLGKEHGIGISGPNCLGNISVPARLVTTPDSRLGDISDGPVAIVGQSGGIVTAINRALVARGIGSRYMVSSGNETCLTTADYLRFFADDPQIRVVVAFVESLRDPQAFAGACDQLAAVGKHLVALKVGRSATGREAAASHTGALAGSYDVFEAVTGTRGVITVGTLEHAIEACEFLSRVPAPRGGRLAVVTVSGGVRELALDSAHAHKTALYEPEGETARALRQLAEDDELEVSNPLDTSFAGLSDPRHVVRCAESFASDPDVGLVLVQEELLTQAAPYKESVLATFNEAFQGGVVAGPSRTPVALFSMAPTQVTQFGRELRERLPNLSFLQGLDPAMAISAALLKSGAAAQRSAPLSDEPAQAARTADALTLLNSVAEMTEPSTKELLRLYGFETPAEVYVTDPDSAADWASSTGLDRFVVKAVVPGLAHKSDQGAVVLDVRDSKDVRHACARILEKLPATTGFIVAEQVRVQHEILLSFETDPEVGPYVAVGHGGTTAELYPSIAILPPRCSREDIQKALETIPLGTILQGWRGGTAADMEAVVKAVQTMGIVAAELGTALKSIEINPLATLADRPGVLVLDALGRGNHE